MYKTHQSLIQIQIIIETLTNPNFKFQNNNQTLTNHVSNHQIHPYTCRSIIIQYV